MEPVEHRLDRCAQNHQIRRVILDPCPPVGGLYVSEAAGIKGIAQIVNLSIQLSLDHTRVQASIDTDERRLAEGQEVGNRGIADHAWQRARVHDQLAGNETSSVPVPDEILWSLCLSVICQYKHACKLSHRLLQTEDSPCPTFCSF